MQALNQLGSCVVYNTYNYVLIHCTEIMELQRVSEPVGYCKQIPFRHTQPVFVSPLHSAAMSEFRPSWRPVPLDRHRLTSGSAVS